MSRKSNVIHNPIINKREKARKNFLPTFLERKKMMDLIGFWSPINNPSRREL